MKYGLIGEKLGHSYSKEIHELIGLYEYELKEIPREELKSFIEGRDYLGLNVTIPYKQDVIPMLDFIDDGAKAIGAVNTIVNKDGKLYGYNTDYYGLMKLIKDSGLNFEGKKVLVLGTGGTSKTSCAVLDSLKVSERFLVSRSGKDGAITYEEAIEKHSDADYIVNTTPSGMFPNIDSAAVDIKSFTSLKGVFDVIYNPTRTKLMLQAEELGIPAYCGLKMLVEQAVVAAGFFVGTKVSEDVSDKIYKIIRGKNENIVLIGMPGVGKSTVGKRLAKDLNMTYVDTDDELVAKEGREITDIFKDSGEAYFRDLEAEVVKECASRKNCIISTGGGAVLRQSSVDVLKAFGRLCFLHRDIEGLRPTADRPLANDFEKIKKLYEERLPIYQRAADIQIDSDNGPDEAVKQIERYRDEY